MMKIIPNIINVYSFDLSSCKTLVQKLSLNNARRF